MALRIRLRRMGRKNAPTYRVVVAESSMPRDGRIVEKIGHYNPRTEPATLSIDRARALFWIERGATPTETAKALLKKAGVFRPEAEASVVATVVEGAKSAATKAGGAVKAAAAKAGGAAKKVAAEAREAASEAVEEARETVAEVAEEIRETTAEVIEEVRETAAEVVEEVRETLGEVVEAAREKIADAVEAVRGEAEDEEEAKA